MIVSDVTMYPGRVFLVLLLPHHHGKHKQNKGKTKERTKGDDRQAQRADRTIFLRPGHKVPPYGTLNPIVVFLRKAITAAVAFSS